MSSRCLHLKPVQVQASGAAAKILVKHGTHLGSIFQQGGSRGPGARRHRQYPASSAPPECRSELCLFYRAEANSIDTAPEFFCAFFAARNGRLVQSAYEQARRSSARAPCRSAGASRVQHAERLLTVRVEIDVIARGIDRLVLPRPTHARKQRRAGLDLLGRVLAFPRPRSRK